MPHQDQKYIDALVNENREVINEIYEKCLPQCIQFVLNNGGTADSANDVFQEALLAVSLQAKSKTIELNVPIGAYLMQVYKNKWVDNLKKRKLSLIDISEIEDNIEVQNEKELQYTIFNECYNQLKGGCKELLEMRIRNMTSKEIAKKLDVKPNTVNQKIYICREKLRKLVQNHPSYKKSFQTEVSSPNQNLKKSKEEILNELAGSWRGVDDSIIEDIYRNRTISDKKLDLD